MKRSNEILLTSTMLIDLLEDRISTSQIRLDYIPNGGSIFHKIIPFSMGSLNRTEHENATWMV